MRRQRRIPLLGPALKRRARLPAHASNWPALALMWRKSRPIGSRRGAGMRHVAVHSQWSPRLYLHIHLPAPDRAPSKLFFRRALRSTVITHGAGAPLASAKTVARTLRTDKTLQLVRRTVRDLIRDGRTIVRSTHQTVGMIFRAWAFPTRSVPTANQLEAAAQAARRSRLLQGTDTVLRMRQRQATYMKFNRVTRHGRTDHADMVLERAGPQARREQVRPADLVWRSEPHADAGERFERSVNAVQSTFAPLNVASELRFEQTMEPPGSSTSPLLDQALIDRLAENVVGRVERRIRIERERRGA